MKKYAGWILGIVVFILILLTLRPVPIDREKSRTIKGTVVKMYEGGVKDLVFQLKETDKIFYINRGLEYRFQFKEISDSLMGKQIQLTYADYFNPINPTQHVNHITELVFLSDTLYSEY